MKYRCLTDLEQIKAYVDNDRPIAFDFETSPDELYRREDKAALDAHKAHIVGISFSVDEGDAIYVPLAHNSNTNAEQQNKLWEFLRLSVFENRNRVKIAHNLAFEAMFLYAKGIIVQQPCYDTIAAAQLTLKAPYEFRTLHDSGLKLLAIQLYGADMPSFEKVTKGRHFDEMYPQEYETVRYACADSDYTLRLYYRFNAWFNSYLPQHRVIVEQLESPTAVYCGMMKYNGVTMDRVLMQRKNEEATSKIDIIKSEIDSITGGVNIGANASTAAFKKYLYETLGLPVLKTTEKNKEAADDAAMQMLKEWCEKHKPEYVRLFELIQEYRKWGKLKSTYIDGYFSHINDETYRIHPDFMPLGTETGRFAARNPNLQNCFDDRTEILTRRGFVLFSDLSDGDEVAQWENGDIYFVRPTEFISYHYEGNMVHLKNQHIDILATPNHRCLLQNRKNNQYFTMPAESYCSDAKQLQAGQFIFGDKHLNVDEITLIAATQADGYYHDGGIDFSFIKARKYRRLLMAIQHLGVPYSDYVKKDGHVNIRILKCDTTKMIMDLLGKDKTWGEWLLNYDRRTIKAILNELPEWDGCFVRGNHYSSSVKINADWMQILYSLTGTRAHLREYHNGNPNSKINYQVDITDRDYSLTSNIQKSAIEYDGMVYCVSVPSSYIVVRRGGQVVITGNCPRKTNDPIGVRNFICATSGNILMSLDF